MAKLFTLLYGKSKKKMKPIMTDIQSKCENYRDARKPNCKGFHDIVEAPEGSTVWRQKSATVGGNKCTSVPRVGRGFSGWIGKNGFNAHT